MPNSAQIYIDHQVAELEGVNFELLNSEDKLLPTAQKVAEQLNLRVVKSFIHRFDPHGLSLMLVLSQSHLAIHTWPEHGYMHVDIVTCSANMASSKFAEVLKKYFSPTKITCRKIEY
ncbi:MAG: S-adenosylmethionine decarboxylase proenzyme [Candidatus Daviesbacteria bacterium GW2011_GWA1_41_61]|uniref:S-adenosylmethionine decarboxylase proenzyme n=1 Tax=Candidatus Daviesbacteria bacterium GW2011_GWA2_40_9 TaxID=1618424 RepID=A0A0G0U909_9BACT|nr:MAG: S-adenosylmethionine decarboxylase proenzyme [Candidatus Daviesbacteria bacterium GW2011_GWC1_40_9]KKR83726.1 MAG: S-adenosylmethionine decarboxylase proenzyme [Candidatus Daviesbacteria bacterium GW2011_GWA2_40_9]KKR93679.1 MAG: S-adenosylmethionine decarboxylase proenzyme [Candidatus Daviesbacteria bacterium GW2011_GWB1_41_15]KKS15145.1 MAG: S-adenosylmethionine decarboxylase proenzyme [Candidatus Daviesbacteria bacterium GW2011_GWA1_41_61]